MNTNKMEKMYELLKDRAFVEQMKNMESPEELQAALANRGVELSDDEMTELIHECKNLADEMSDELSEDQLERVVGGAAITITVLYVVLITIGAVKIACWAVKKIKVKTKTTKKR